MVRQMNTSFPRWEYFPGGEETLRTARPSASAGDWPKGVQQNNEEENKHSIIHNVKLFLIHFIWEPESVTYRICDIFLLLLNPSLTIGSIAPVSSARIASARFAQSGQKLALGITFLTLRSTKTPISCYMNGTWSSLCKIFLSLVAGGGARLQSSL